MLKYTRRLKDQFLDYDWCERMTGAGINMSDSKFCLVELEGATYVADKVEDAPYLETVENKTDTYTLTELYYKLDEYPKNYGTMTSWKDAPFYFFCYYGEEKMSPEDKKKYTVEEYGDCPLHGAARLLLTCVELGIPYVHNVSQKDGYC